MNKLRVFHGGSVISSQLVDSIAICGGSLGELGGLVCAFSSYILGEDRNRLHLSPPSTVADDAVCS